MPAGSSVKSREPPVRRPPVGSRLLRTAIREGDRQLRRTSIRAGEEFRELRLRCGISQAAVARAIGVDRAVICRLEMGDTRVRLETRAHAAAVLGATVKLSLFADGEPLIRDAAHARAVEWVLEHVAPQWRVTLEAPVPGLGRRATDVRAEAADDIVLIEIETRVPTLETAVRELQSKRAAVLETCGGRCVWIVLALPSSRANRALVAAHPRIVSAVLPGRSDEILRALGETEGSWPGDGILWIPVAAAARGSSLHRGV